ncbi:MAG: hypothetical protein RBS87_02330 [Acholeplasma sp.]|jgi:hypothetical protein|nr:hypothetical protein [Acholeplasma sp.]
MKKIIIQIGSFILDPIRKFGQLKFSDRVVSFSNKNPWLKMLIAFIVVGVLIVLVYVI